MLPHPRYDILEKIASGDFATVYRARDKELNRDVAIKAIHPQFLEDQRQLERYWEEAQLLASLEHPNIMSIYDIDRSRGWLILELMADSVKNHAGGQPLDLNFLRLSLVCSLQALKFLHSNNIVHGDVKPSNLLIDRRNWIKLGDFGLAQRATNDQGSLFKGTTRYIAPERVSDQFGPVGPASDLYSLGFSMYELMCGDAFDSLFPGLSAFGRDQQMAWMMWHAAPDRRIPPINRVLQGVPEDLQRVIERLVTKDRAIRYSAADEAIRDLKTGMGLGPGGPTEAERAASEAAASQTTKKKRQKILYIAAAVSIAFCILLVFLPKPETPKPPPQLQSVSGVIKHIYLDKQKVVIAAEGRDRPIVEVGKNDDLFLNDEPAKLTDLKEGDFLTTEIKRDESGKHFEIVYATRPDEDRGTVTAMLPDKNAFVLQTQRDDGGTKTNTIQLRTQDEPTTFVLNGNPWPKDKPFSVMDLKKGDEIALQHEATKDGVRVAVGITAIRSVFTSGTLHGFNPPPPEEPHTLTIKEANGRSLELPLASKCQIILNGRTHIGGRYCKATDLQPGDQVELKHSTEITRIIAERDRERSGILQALFPSRRELRIQLDGGPEADTFSLPNNTSITLDGNNVDIQSLQPGDQIKIHYDAADPDKLVALDIAASRLPDRRRWAVIIGIEDYNDRVLTPVEHLADDAQLVYDALTTRYRLAEDQTKLLQNVVRNELMSTTSAFLKRIRPEDDLIFYFAGHGYLDSNNTPYLAAKNFNFLKIRETGIPLKWLVDEIENCRASNKLLLLDTCHEGTGSDLQDQPSSKEFMLQLEQDRAKPALKSLSVVASCEPMERGLRGATHGQFATALGNAYRGAADESDDQQISTDELFAFLQSSLHNATNEKQTPALITPLEVIPNRLSDEAKLALRRMVLEIDKDTIDLGILRGLGSDAENASPGQPEVQLLYGLAELKAGDGAGATETFSAVREFFPQHDLIALAGIAGALAQQEKYNEAAEYLTLWVRRAGREAGIKSDAPDPTKLILRWIGRVREYAVTVARENQHLTNANASRMDESAAFSGKAVETLYLQGRDQVTKQIDDFDRRFPELKNSKDTAELNHFRRKLIAGSISFPFMAATEQIILNLEN